MTDKKILKKVETTHEEKTEANINFLVGAAPSAEEFLDEYNHCPLCGTELVYSHVTQFVQSQVTEEAHCEKCNLCTKNNQHSLH